MTNFKSTYERKSFTREQWQEIVQESNPYDWNNGDQGWVEPSIPKLLLNYFVVMAYEESSIRMARELGYIKCNKDVTEFNNLYMIKKRAYIKELIKKGEVLLAMEKITEIFGIEVLENLNDHVTDEDLHFKLLLLNLIEMIREHNNKGDKENQEQFVLDLLQYAQDKLAVKATSKKEYLREVELVMTLLLFPLSKDEDLSALPKGLRQLYSLNLRTKIADLVNRKLLQSILPQIKSQAESSGFVDLLGSSFQTNEIPCATNVVRSIPKEVISTDTMNGELAYVEEQPVKPVGSSTELSGVQGEIFEEIGESVSQYYIPHDVKLVQLVKLWAWCENLLHSSDIGVPRVENPL